MDVIILGGGPAGASAALYTARAGLNTLVIYKDEGALKKAERIENFYGAEHGISGEELFCRGISNAKACGAQVAKDEIVSFFSDGKEIELVGIESKYKARALIIASGAKRLRPIGLDVEKYEGAGVSYCVLCDGFFFRGKKVALLGSGEYARHELAELLRFTSDVSVLTNGEKAENFGVPTLTGKIEALFGEGSFEGVQIAGEKHKFDGLFIALGTAGAADFARTAGILTEGDRVVTDSEGATNLQGIFAAGDCAETLKQVSVAVGSGARAALATIKYLKKG